MYCGCAGAAVLSGAAAVRSDMEAWRSGYSAAPALLKDRSEVVTRDFGCATKVGIRTNRCHTMYCGTMAAVLLYTRNVLLAIVLESQL